MTETTDRHIVFKVCGNFDWPGSNGPGRASKLGQFHFYYAVNPGTGKLTAGVEWIPGDATVRSGSGKLAEQDISELDGEALDALRRGDTGFNYWLEKPLKDGKGIIVTGARVVEQFRPGPKKPVRELRWPLASGFQYGNRTGTSAVYFGTAATDAVASPTMKQTFGFRLVLPSPTPHGMVDGEPVYVFPFRVRYPVGIDAIDKAGEAVELAAGYEGTDSECPWIDIADAGLDDNRLGKFGFSRRGDHSKYACFPRTDANGSRTTEALWLRDVDTFLDKTLSRFAKVDDNLRKAVALPIGRHRPSRNPEQYESVLPTGAEGGCKIFFRSSFSRDEREIKIRTGDFLSPEADLNNKNRFLTLKTPSNPPGGDGILLEYGDEYDFRVRENGADVTYSANRIKIDQNLSFDLSNEQIADYADGRAVTGTIERSLPFLASESGHGTIEPRNFLDPGSFNAQRLVMKELFTRAIGSFRLPRIAVSVNEAGDAVHAVPYATLSNLENLHFALSGAVAATLDANGRIAEEEVDLPRESWPKFECRLGVYKYDKQRELETRNETAGVLALRFPGLESPGGARGLTVFKARLGAAGIHPEDGWMRLGLEFLSQSGSKPFVFRLGGLVFSGAQTVHRRRGEWNFRTATIIESPVNPGGRQEFAADEFDFQVALGVDRVEPSGVDRSRQRRDQRSAPLLLQPDVADDDGSEPSFIVVLREEARLDADRHFTATVHDTGAGGGQSRPYVLLSREPFSVAALTMQTLAARGGEDDSAVATYDGDTRTWLFNVADERFYYRLPPQGVGESMDKPGWLEIVDETADYADGRPYRIVERDGEEKTRLPALRRRAVDYRLAAPAELWVEPSDLERSFVLPEWAMQELFRQKGDFGVGARLAGLRAEWIYGLAASIDPSRELGPARGARVAEIEVLLGRFPDLDKSPSGEAGPRWNRLRRMLDSRPERLEMWMPNPALDGTFEPARFEDSVRFALRRHAQMRYPFPLPDADDGEEGENLGLENGPGVTRHGLMGGAIWGLESSAYIREFLHNPNSTGGKIERVALSPHGGDVDLRAEFLGGLLAIIAEVRGGRVQRQRIEILGRIGVFWHRAKHVVIYERTTSPSAQFTPNGGLNDRTRRPVIRKVEEFVELLQPERSYPDTADTDAVTTGFLKAGRFNSTRIHVDSAWSENVGENGWKIPLWNRQSAKERPSVYPRPDIAFVVHSEGEEQEPLAAQECLDPENLFFYSDATATTSDTDQWLPVLSVDWTNLPPPSHEHQPSVDERASPDHPSKPSAQRFARGYRRFTWRLAPSSRRAHLNYGRSGKPIFARLETLTFSRAASDASNPRAEQVGKALGAVSKALVEDRFAGIDAAMTDFRQAVERGAPDPVRAAAHALREKLRNAEFGGVLDHGDDLKEFHELVEQAMGAPGKCHKMVDDFVGGLQRKRLLVVANVNEWRADAESITGRLKDSPKREDWIRDASAEVRNAIGPALGIARTDLGNFRSQVEQARSIVDDLSVEGRALIARAERELHEAHEAYDDKKPWSPARLLDYQQQLEGARASLFADAEAALADVRQRLATETTGLAQQLGRATGAALDTAARTEDGLLTQLGAAETASLAVLNETRETIRKTSGALTDNLDKIARKVPDDVPEPDRAAVLEALREAREKIGAANELLEAGFDRLRREIRQGRRDLSEVIAGLGDFLRDVGEQFGDAIDEAAKSVQSAIDQAGDTLKALLEELKGDTEKFTGVVQTLSGEIAEWGKRPDRFVGRVRSKLDFGLAALDRLIRSGNAEIARQVETIDNELDGLQRELETDKVMGHIVKVVIRPAFDLVVPKDTFDSWKGDAKQVAVTLEEAIAEIDAEFRRADGALMQELASLQSQARAACDTLQAGVAGIRKWLDKEAADLRKDLGELADKLGADEIEAALADLGKLYELVGGANEEFSQLRKRAGNVRAQYDAYADRVFEEAGKLGKGGLAAAPSNVLRLWSTVASAPDVPNLDYTRKRLGYYYRELNNVIDTTPAEAFFGRLGSQLKAMGISLPFDRFESKLVLLDPSQLDIGRVFNNFCGIDLRQMFKGIKLPARARDAIRLTHDLDEKAFRAWAQLDIDLPMPGRRSLFTIGPFKLDFVDMRMLGRVRLEASKDSDRVAQSGHARLVTTIDAVVSGQSMVQLRKVVLEFDRHGKLDVRIDPKNIKINPALEFVQEALASLFPDNVGGLQIVKNNGLPVGVEHIFSIPPISAMGVTSGISNLAISNRFSLLAFPDFVIANRFALSRPDMPFLFTIFVIGGSGYINVDAEYRPFNSELAVSVEAAAGGSAALGFSLGPVSGTVYVSLSVALSYRKVIGRRGGGLTVSVLLVIAGNVDVAGLARVNLTLLLRMYYRSNSQIDGLGTVSVSFRVSRFFKYRYRSNYKKTLRKGKSGSQANRLAEATRDAQGRPVSRAKAMMEARA